MPQRTRSARMWWKPNHAKAQTRTQNPCEGRKISRDKSAVEAAVADLKSVLEGEDAEVIKEKTNVLAQVAMKLGEALYKQSSAGASTDGEVPNMEKDDADDDIVDADFTEVGDDDKKTS